MSKEGKEEGVLQQAKTIGDEIVNDIARQVQSDLTKRAANSIVDLITDAMSNKQPSQQTIRTDLQFQKRPCEFSNDIEGMKENRQWSYGGTDGIANPFVLSAQTNHFSYSEIIANLQTDEFLVMKFRVLKVDTVGQFSNALEIVALGENSLDSGWVFTFSPGEDKVIKGGLKLNGRYESKNKFDLPSYLPNQINTLVIYYDTRQAVIVIELNEEIIDCGIIIGQFGSFEIKTRVVGMDVCFWG